MKDKMKNIHVLATDKPSRLYLGNNGNFVFGMMQTSIQSRNDDFTNQNIYITSDEEIKEGDYYISILENEVYKSTKETQNIMSVANLIETTTYKHSHFKIILTTDQSLDGVQSIDDEFLEWFVKNPSCEEVKVRKNPKVNAIVKGFGVKSFNNGYKTIIPKEEPKKVLTEEDIFNQKDIDAVTDYINKEQQKQHLIDMMESDEELGLYDEKIEDIELEEVRGSSHCQFSVVENKLAIIYRNQLKILQAIKMLNNGKRNQT